jgi:hypothetical protein
VEAMHFQLLSTLLAGAALSACAATPDPQVAKQDASNCQMEYRTGSSIPTRNCTPLTDEQRAQQKRDVDDFSRSLHRGSTSAVGGGGG